MHSAWYLAYVAATTANHRYSWGIYNFHVLFVTFPMTIMLNGLLCGCREPLFGWVENRPFTFLAWYFHESTYTKPKTTCDLSETNVSHIIQCRVGLGTAQNNSNIAQTVWWLDNFTICTSNILSRSFLNLKLHVSSGVLNTCSWTPMESFRRTVDELKEIKSFCKHEEK